MSTLPDLRTREAIQSYLRGLAAELGMSLGDPRLAAELDKRDKLAEFRSKFHVPIISDFLEKEERAEGGWLMWMVPNLLSLSLVCCLAFSIFSTVECQLSELQTSEHVGQLNRLPIYCFLINAHIP